MTALLAFAVHHPVVAALGAATVLGVVGKFLLPLLTTCQDLLDSCIRMSVKLLVVMKSASDVSTQTIVYRYLNHLTRGYGNLDDTYEAMYDHIKPLGRRQAYFVRYTWHTWRLWFYGRAPVLMVPHGSEDKPTFLFFRGTLDWDRLVLEACAWRYDREVEEKEREQQVVRRFQIHHIRGNVLSEPAVLMKGSGSKSNPPSNTMNTSGGANTFDVVGWRHEDIGHERPDDPTNVLAMNEAMLETERQVEFWMGHQSWYKEREIPWKMGVLLHGPPGTGKTSLVRAIAQKLDLPVYAFHLTTMDSREFVQYWAALRSEATKIVLLEDIDTVFNGRKNALKDHRLSFDVLLNTLDGIDEDDGTLLFVTTNNIDAVDPALGRPDADGQSSRPGRVDLTFEIGKLDHAGRVKIARRILLDDLLADKMALDFPDDTPVVFRERCRKLAINMLWGRE